VLYAESRDQLAPAPEDGCRPDAIREELDCAAVPWALAAGLADGSRDRRGRFGGLNTSRYRYHKYRFFRHVTAGPLIDCVQKRGVLRTTLVRGSEASLAEVRRAAIHGHAAAVPPRAISASGNEQKITFVLTTYEDF
jgi:hypothetical protein